MPTESAPQPEFRRILVPIDLSAHAQSAVRYAKMAAEGDPSKLYMLHVVEPYHPSWKIESAESQRECRIEERAQFEAFIRKEFAGGKLPHMNCEVGHPVEEIIKRAEALKADLIVVGTHGRGGFKRAMIGSVAERIVRYAPCPVLVVR